MNTTNSAREVRISLCIPAMNRLEDLIAAMPRMIKAANASPPVEVALLNYNSTDDLEAYVQTLKDYPLHPLNRIIYSKYTGARKTYHMSHARNLSVIASTGEYVVISSCDILLDENFFTLTREKIEAYYPPVISYEREKGVVCIQRNEFIAAGGFDERFVYYGSEDRDLFDRLVRRTGEPINILSKPFYAIYTPEHKKLANYGARLNKQRMIEINRAVYLENCAQGVLVANMEGWASWL